MIPDVDNVLEAPRDVSVRLSLGVLSRGGDPGLRADADGTWWRATRTPEGPATGAYRSVDRRRVHVRAWGPGSAWLVAHAGELLGFDDDDTGFTPPEFLAETARRHPGLHLPRTRSVYEALLLAILEQKVTGADAIRAFRAMVRAWGEPAPGPAELWLVPRPDVLAARSYAELHPFNVEMKRANTLIRVARRADALERTTDMPRERAHAALMSLEGIGPWTAGSVAEAAWGDPDAVAVGDYHLPNAVTYAFTGEPRGDDARMLQLLEPWRGHRARVVRLIGLAGISAPRFGPRAPRRDIRRM